MKKSWKTSLFGVAVLACELIGELKPAYKPICTNVIEIAVGLGLIAAADSQKNSP